MNRHDSFSIIKIGVLVLLLGVLLGQMLLSSRQKSAAFDETFHLMSGYSFVSTGEPRLQWEHPPLPQVLAGAALLGQGLTPIPTDDPAWQAGDAEHFVDEYLWVQNGSLAADMIWRGRVPLIILTTLFGLAFFLALREFASETAAWVGLTLFAFDPNIIANGRLIGNDMVVSGMMFVAVWRIAVYLKRPSWLNLVLTGIAAGFAFTSKLTSTLLIPIFLVIVLTYKLPAVERKRAIGRRVLALVGMAIVSLWTLWAMYGFEFGRITPNLPPIPAPTFFGGIPRMINRVQHGTPTFLLGQTDANGWWYYFPITFLLKTPLPSILLLSWAAIQLRANRWRETIIWWFPTLLMLVVAINSSLQIGYRLIMPLLVFGLAWAASSVDRWPLVRWQQAVLGAFGTWLVVSAAMTYPNYMSFSNVLAGGTRNTWRTFADMNVDWGQDLPALAQYMRENPDEQMYLSYFGSAFPAAYGVEAEMLPGFARVLAGPAYRAYNAQTPPPGTYAISATSIQLGLVHEGRDLFAHFRDREPDGMAGGSILLYRVADDNRPIQRTVVNDHIVWRLPNDTLALDADERLIAKWSGAGATVLPMSGPAHWVLDGGALPSHPLVQQAIEQGDARPLAQLLPRQQGTTPDGTPIELGAFDNGLELIGWDTNAAAYRQGELVVLTTFWRVNQPWRDEFKLFLHVIDETGVPFAQWDGWSVAAAGLEAGDVIVVEHPMWLPAELAAGEYQIQAGFYRPNSGARFNVAGADRLFLSKLSIVE